MYYYTIETMPFGENCYILYDDVSKEAAIIDPGGSFRQIVDFIDKKELNAKYILLTHSHADHIGALNDLLDKYDDIELIASSKERKLLNNPMYNLTSRFNMKHTQFEATKYVEDKDTIKMGEHTITFYLTPGHTAGSMCIGVGDMLFTGDTLFAGSIGRTDLPTGSFDEISKSLVKLANMDENLTIFPGHGPSSTIGQEKRTNPFLR